MPFLQLRKTGILTLQTGSGNDDLLFVPCSLVMTIVNLGPAVMPSVARRDDQMIGLIVFVTLQFFEHTFYNCYAYILWYA